VTYGDWGRVGEAKPAKLAKLAKPEISLYIAPPRH
jgi:hypothetical protein